MSAGSIYKYIYTTCTRTAVYFVQHRPSQPRFPSHSSPYISFHLPASCTQNRRGVFSVLCISCFFFLQTQPSGVLGLVCLFFGVSVSVSTPCVLARKSHLPPRNTYRVCPTHHRECCRSGGTGWILPWQCLLCCVDCVGC